MARRRALPVLLAFVAGILGGVASADDAAPCDPAALDDPSWDVRREAETRLFRDGEACLARRGAPEDGSDEPPGPLSPEEEVRLREWSRVLEEGLARGSPTAQAAVRRVLRRLEALGEDEQVRRIPLLLRARIDRRLPQTVVEFAAEVDFGAFRPGSRGRGDAGALEGLFPEARPILLDVVAGSDDPRRLAAAIAALAHTEAGGDDEAALLDAIAQRWSRDRLRLSAVAGYIAQDGFPPAVTVGLALALSGRAGDAARMLRRAGNSDETLVGMLRERLPGMGLGDLTQRDFLGWALRGEIGPSEAVDAALEAEKAGLPWLARVNARRALFLDPADAAARAALVRADLALRLFATAREDAKGAPLPPETPSEDDPAARRIDAALSAGALHQRILYRKEAGRRTGSGLVPVALGPGALVYGTTSGRVVLADPETGAEQVTLPSEAMTLPRSVAVTQGLLAAVSASQELLVWSRTGPDAPRVAHVRGVDRFLAVVATVDGGFVAVGEGRAIWRVSPAGEAAAVTTVAREPGFDPRSVVVLPDGTLVLANDRSAEHVDLASGAMRIVLRDRRNLWIAGYAGDVVAVYAGRCGRFASDGGIRWSQQADTGTAGIAADGAARAIYLTIADRVVALDAEDGSFRWAEPIEGTGSAAVGDGLLAVPAGSGGSQRRDRTITVLRSSPPDNALFETAARQRLLATALEVANAGRRSTAKLLVDPLRGWLTAAEVAPLDAVLGED